MTVAIQGLTRKPQSPKKRVKHAVNTATAFMDTAIRNLSGENPDVAEAKRIYEIGRTKLSAAISELDLYEIKEEFQEQEQQYVGIQEEQFTADNHEVVRWTEFFHSRVKAKKIFEDFEESQPSSASRARVVGVYWQRFSAFMPWFLCEAAARVSTNEKRHYVIQTAFEELGMRNVREIHPEMFWSTAKQAGVLEADRSRLVRIESGIEVLRGLKAAILSASDDETIMGLLLGLEIPAEENIETVFRSLAHTEEKKQLLEVSKFFQLHRQIEIEHVRLTVSNFLRFCQTEEEQKRFISGFDQGVSFWAHFWADVATAISAEFPEVAADV